jgi:uncharacterized membrane protein required for colicin V production
VIWIDCAIFVVLFSTLFAGLSCDPMLQFLRTVGLFLAFFIALICYGVFGSILQGIFSPSMVNMVSYFVIFGFVCIVVNVLIDYFKNVVNEWNFGGWSSLLGGLLGVIGGVVLCGVVIFGILGFCGKSTCAKIHNSLIAPHIGRLMQNMVCVIPVHNPNTESQRSEDNDGQREVQNDAKLSKVEDAGLCRLSR